MTPLHIACRRLRNADPQAWADFLAEMEKWVAGKLLELSAADFDKVFVAQGRAQDSQALFRIFNECHLEPKPKPGAQ